MHVVDPETGLKLPLVQVVQVEAPVLEEKVPAGHFTHVALVMEPTKSEYDPASQGVQEELPAFWE